jgi:beta-N-acetylhexosaminidase
MKVLRKLSIRFLSIFVAIVCMNSDALATSESLDLSEMEKIQDIMSSLTPEQKVGQLFLVSFDGTDSVNETYVHKLVSKYRVGGVMLIAQNDNFQSSNDVLLSISKLTNRLQRIVWQNVNEETIDTIELPLPGLPSLSNPSDGYLPLLIGTKNSLEQGGYISVQDGLTSIPSALAIGATWNTDLALSMGEIAGEELSAMGINLYVGPKLDVADAPIGNRSDGSGLSTFGGSPYWVGEMIRSFVIGVHRGSSGGIAFVGESFPGLGAADSGNRLDIPVVNKSLDELIESDLVPYRAVTELSLGSDETIDVLMPAHARYSAWQGSVSIDTRPLGLDSGSLSELFSLQVFSAWRDQGGLVMSSALGREGIRRFYDPTSSTFPAFEIALDAFLAGNDILFLDDFVLDKADNQYDTVVSTIELFVRKYREDGAFAERIDRSVERIIATKLRLYDNDLSILNIQERGNGGGFEDNEAQVFQVALEAVTLLSPSKTEFVNRVPREPLGLDRIVIFTDSRAYNPCSICEPKVRPAVNALENSIDRLYGAGGIRQNSTLELFSFSFLELYKYIAGNVSDMGDGRSVDNSEIGNEEDMLSERSIRSIDEALTGADWLVFTVGDIQDRSNTNALKLVLAERPDILSDKNVIVFAMGAPYYFDATDLSQFTAYYGLYGDSSAFVEVAARVLFQEIVPHEFPPVSIDAVSYDLHQNLSPNPDQSFIISSIQDSNQSDSSDLALVNSLSDDQTNGTGVVAIPTAALVEIEQGSTVSLQTSVLMDHNSNNVPNGTTVEFDASYLAEGGLTETFAISKTFGGVAVGTIVLDRVGLVEISARSGDAVSEPFQLDVLSERNELVENNEKQVDPTSDISSIVTTIPAESTPTSEIDLASVVLDGLTTGPANEVVEIIHDSTESEPNVYIDPRDLMSAILSMIVIGGVAWSIAGIRGMVPLLKSRIRLLLFVTVGVWSGYDYYALRLPVPEILLNFGGLAPALLAWTGGFIGLLAGNISPERLLANSRELRKLGSKRSNDS